jgi:2-phosphoglycerate kinase
LATSEDVREIIRALVHATSALKSLHTGLRNLVENLDKPPASVRFIVEGHVSAADMAIKALERHVERLKKGPLEEFDP